MADSTNEKRPVRKLTVKNFSVIKEAELEFGKITVLIGPQGSGKSLLCKLAYFLSKRTLEVALSTILSSISPGLDTFHEFKSSLTRDFLEWFPFQTWRDRGTRISFESQAYRVNVLAVEQFDGLEMEFSTEFTDAFFNLSEIVQRVRLSGAEARKFANEQMRAQLYLLLTGPSLTDPFVHRPLYVPDGRAFFTNQTLGFNVVNNPEIDPVLKEFSLEVSWGSAQSPNPLLGEDGVRLLDEIRREMLRIAGGNVEGRNGSARFRRAIDGKSIPLPLVSSGTQAILPLFNVLWQMITEQRGRILFPRPDNLPGLPNQIILSKGLVFLEEPESNIFPSTQYELIRLFAWLTSEWRLDFSWAITTHSPYILTAFNTLIEAWRAGNKPGKREQVSAIIPEKYWINENDFAAYTIRDGVLIPIFENETEGKEGSGLIDGDYLDSVSDQLGSEFEKLLDIAYAE
jgi:energy-coupling factor transporter ATP-binding protein EcfA2